LDAAEAYHREVARSSGNVPAAVRELLPRLRDPAFAKVVHARGVSARRESAQEARRAEVVQS
jgi:hypothetical protein